MGKDDYYVIVAKILIFLYKKLKGKAETTIGEYIVPMTKDFPIDEDYLQYVIVKLFERGYVENVLITRAWGGEVISVDVSLERPSKSSASFNRDRIYRGYGAQSDQQAAGCAWCDPVQSGDAGDPDTQLVQI